MQTYCLRDHNLTSQLDQYNNSVVSVTNTQVYINRVLWSTCGHANDSYILLRCIAEIMQIDYVINNNGCEFYDNVEVIAE